MILDEEYSPTLANGKFIRFGRITIEPRLTQTFGIWN